MRHSHSVPECDFYGLLSENKKKMKRKEENFIYFRVEQFSGLEALCEPKKIISIVNYSYILRHSHLNVLIN